MVRGYFSLLLFAPIGVIRGQLKCPGLVGEDAIAFKWV
jgi:hypothetical protein